MQAGFAPEPGLVGGRLIKAYPGASQAVALGVEIVAFKIDDGGAALRLRVEVEREGGLSAGTFESGVMRTIDDKVQAQQPVEGLGCIQIAHGDGHLIQAHRGFPLLGRIRNAVDRASHVVGDKHGAVGLHEHIDRAAPRL